MSPVKTQLKRLADKLTDEDAGLVLALARKLASRQRQAEEDRNDLEAALRAEAEMAVSGEAPIPWERVKAEAGL